MATVQKSATTSLLLEIFRHLRDSLYRKGEHFYKLSGYMKSAPALSKSSAWSDILTVKHTYITAGIHAAGGRKKILVFNKA